MAPPVAAAPAAVPSVPAAATSPPAPKDRRPAAALRLHGGAEVGALPGPTGAVGLALGLLWPRLRVELQGTVLAPRTTTGMTPPVTASLYSGAVHGCARPGRRAIEVLICVGLELGAMRGETSGVPGARAAAAFWLAAVLAPGLA